MLRCLRRIIGGVGHIVDAGWWGWRSIGEGIPQRVYAMLRMRQMQQMLLPVTASALVPFVLIWGFSRLLPPAESFGDILLGLLLFSLVYLVSIVVHEGLHAVAMIVVGGVSWRSIRFGLRLREGVAYVHTDRPLTVRSYRAVLAAPGILTGVLPIAVAIVLGNAWLLAYGYVMTLSAAGDVAILLLLRNLPPDLPVRDHPSDVGCQVRRS